LSAIKATLSPTHIAYAVHSPPIPISISSHGSKHHACNLHYIARSKSFQWPWLDMKFILTSLCWNPIHTCNTKTGNVMGWMHGMVVH
jgi:hypothetical protein